MKYFLAIFLHGEHLRLLESPLRKIELVCSSFGHGRVGRIIVNR